MLCCRIESGASPLPHVVRLRRAHQYAAPRRYQKCGGVRRDRHERRDSLPPQQSAASRRCRSTWRSSAAAAKVRRSSPPLPPKCGRVRRARHERRSRRCRRQSVAVSTLRRANMRRLCHCHMCGVLRRAAKAATPAALKVALRRTLRSLPFSVLCVILPFSTFPLFFIVPPSCHH